MPLDRKSRRALLEAARAAGSAKAEAGPSAARSQDFLYGDDRLPPPPYPRLRGREWEGAWPEGELTGRVALAILRGMTDLAPELARLSPRQRHDLIGSLWESLDDKDVPVTDAQRAELDRRITGFDQDQEQSIPWDQLRADLRQRR